MSGGLGLGNCGCGCEPPPCVDTITLHVVGCDGQPLPGASVTLTWDDGGVSGETDGAGLFVFDNPSAVDKLTRSATGTVTATGFLDYPLAFLISCYGPSDGLPNPIQMLVDDDNWVCGCGCVSPFPKSIPITTPFAAGDLVWDGSRWKCDLTWHDDSAVKVITGFSDLGRACSCCLSEPGDVKATYILTCTSTTDAYGNKASVWTLAAGFTGCIQAKAVAGGPRDNDCYKVIGSSSAFVPWCDSQGATEYDVFHLLNISSAAAAGAGWTDSITIECGSGVLDFSGTLPISFPPGSDVPLSATVIV